MGVNNLPIYGYEVGHQWILCSFTNKECLIEHIDSKKKYHIETRLLLLYFSFY